VTLWALRRAGSDITQSYLRGLAAAAVLITIAIVGGWTVLGIALGLSYGVVVAPSVWTAYRTAVPSGIAPLTWWIGAVEALLWGSFGWYHNDRGILTFMVVGVTSSTLMLVRYYTTRDQIAALEVAV
jgi:hypothetical protein